MTLESTNKVIVIGAGIFGISTTIALAKRYPGLEIHVLDRFEPPVPDGSSVDTTRCIRVDYTSEIYSELASESLAKIKKDPVISKFFHETGMSYTYDGKHDKWEDFYLTGKSFAEKANKGNPGKIVCLDSTEEVFRSIHGKEGAVPSTSDMGRETWWNKGYRNMSNGFIDAGLAMKAYYERANSYPNVTFTFCEVEKLNYYPGTKKFKSVVLQNGEEIPADLVVIAAGAWSGKLVNLQNICKMSAVEVGWLKLTPEEQESWKDMSITTNLSTGINLFPPYNGEMKVLRRSPGYKNTVSVANPDPEAHDSIEISYPRTRVTNPSDWIPKDAEIAIRENLKEILPSLYKRPFNRTRLCWLTQTPSANFLIDHHPHSQNVLLATGGSAHAWKFVPVIGDKVVDFMEGNLAPHLVELWSWKEKLGDKADNGSAPRMVGEPQEISKVIRTSGNEDLCI
ncbi:hypothetical protein PMKS-001294 [Pichia membranifaciens]|uniref:FAD dependent oxidoreductase domain-containing protein n=1 Tax=Pichia membranifaciens TaxID=4926 RepID=A0A1Q2YE24_9ASCO|nr:hypothetical protein PMKS-001294 [Pichia membranifaciens]